MIVKLTLKSSHSVSPELDLPFYQVPDGWCRDQIATARRVAGVLGPQSAAAMAVAEYEKQYAAGTKPRCVLDRGAWHILSA